MTYALVALVALVIAGRELESRRAARVVADLCQRLQAPDTAVAQHVMQQPDFQTAHLPFDDDAAWLKYTTDGVVTTDDLA